MHVRNLGPHGLLKYYCHHSPLTTVNHHFSCPATGVKNNLSVVTASTEVRHTITLQCALQRCIPDQSEFVLLQTQYAMINSHIYWSYK